MPYNSPVIMQMDVSVTELRPIPGLPNFFDVTSVLSANTSTLDYFGITSIECGSELETSNAIEIHILGTIFEC